jgi:Protein of unknown function (DUF4199)
MNKIVWTFGLISGAILSVMMLLTIPFESSIGYDRGEIIGYATMVLSFLLVFFGIRSYRDNVAGGSVSFGRALAVGALITVISSVCYVATWEVIYFKLAPDFFEKFTAYTIEKLKRSGASAAEVQQRTAEMQQFAERYKNPLFNSAVTFLEPLPVGLAIALVSAGVLRRKRNGAGGAALATSTVL